MKEAWPVGDSVEYTWYLRARREDGNAATYKNISRKVSICRASRVSPIRAARVNKSKTRDGRAFRILNVIEEFTRECLMIRVKRKHSSIDVIDVLTDLCILRGPPA